MKLQGIVLAGTYDWGSSALTSLGPRPLLPVAQTPLIHYVLRWLWAAGVSDATICEVAGSNNLSDELGAGCEVDLQLRYHQDRTPRGTAGSARDVGLACGADTLLIADGTAIPTASPEQVLQAHRLSGAALTVVVHGDFRDGELAADQLSPAGIYVVDRSVLEFVAADGFQDIKETLIPRLHAAGLSVFPFCAEGACPRVIDPESYLAVNEWAVECLSRDPGFLEGFARRGQALVHHSARVHATARLLGPVMVGPFAAIQREATVVGPASVSERCVVGEGALLSRSVVWKRSVVGDGATVDRCILGTGSRIEPRAALFNAVKVQMSSLTRPVAPRARRAPGMPTSLPLPRWVRLGNPA